MRAGAALFFVTATAFASPTETLVWTKVDDGQPLPRLDASMAFDPSRGVTWLYGGQWSYNDTTWSWDGTKWSKSWPQHLPPFQNASIAFDPITSNVIAYGVNGQSGRETWMWNGVDWANANALSNPTDVGALALATDPVTGNIIAFGGIDSNNKVLAETWTWTGTTWT